MIEFKCCGNCAKYHPNSNFNDKNGVCKEYEMLVYYYRPSCGGYCKKECEGEMKYQKEHKKSTLNHWNKEELIDYIIMLEHNINAVSESLDIQYGNCLKLLDEMKLVNKTYFEAKETVKRSLYKGGDNNG